MKKRLFGILLSLALMLTMVPVLGLSQTTYATDGPLVNTVIKKYDALDLRGVYIEESPGTIYQGNDIFTLVDIRCNLDDHMWDFVLKNPMETSTIHFYIPGETSINPIGFRIASGNGTEGDAYKIEFVLMYPLQVGHTSVTDENKDNVLDDEGKTVSYDPVTSTLTLNGATIGESGTDYDSISSMGIDLKIVLKGVNTVYSGTHADSAVYVGAYNDQGGALTIEGVGSLTVNGTYFGIHADNDITINGGNINVTGAAGGIYSEEGRVIANGGTITAEGKGGISNPTSVNAAALGALAGIIAEDVEVKSGIDNLTAIGADVAIYGKVKNEIPGKGWEKKDGSGLETAIAVNTSGQELSFKKIQFQPTPAPTPSPAANPLTVTTTAKSTTRSTTIKWTWNAVDGASKYKVAYHKVGSKKWKVKTTKKTKYVLKGQKIKGLYEYKVAAVTASGDVWSDTSCRYFKTVKTRAKFSKGALKVSWKKDKGAAGYEVFIARNKKMDGAQVIQVAATDKSYSVTGLEKGRYYVKVRPMKNYNGVTYTGILCKARKVKVK